MVATEKRRIQRTRVLKCAKIAMDQSLRDCLVRDISSLGVCVAFTSAARIPASFELTFDAGRTFRKCRVAWRSETQVGVEFQAISI
jgi:hypothetical protein